MTAPGRTSPKLFGRRRELAALDRMLDDARCGQSAVLVLRGESGVGKTALLDYLLDRASDVHVAQIAGAELEMELAYAGLHQLCGPMLHDLEKLPSPQREALGVAFGLREGKTPDQFLLAIAVLSLLAESSAKHPLLCVIDDVQWLDRASVQALSFVARRILADPIAMVFAVREPNDERELTGLPELMVEALDDTDARALLAAAMPGAIDERVRERILAEARGNPLALLQLQTGPTPAELAGGYGLAQSRPLARRIENSFSVQLRALPRETRQLLLIAAADPIGNPTSLWRAAELLGLGIGDATPAEEADLIAIDTRVRFQHPLVRSAIYRGATLSSRRRAHQALAEAIDPQSDEELRAWHRAQAVGAPDEAIAQELESSAEQASRRGGVAAAAAFLDRATHLTPDPVQRARRALAAGRAKLDAGAPDAALELVAIAEAGTSDDQQSAQQLLLRARVAFAGHRGGDAPLLFLAAAARLTPLDELLARETYLEALMASIFAGRLSSQEGADPKSVVRAAKAAPPAPKPARAVDLLLDALVVRFSSGYSAAAPLLNEALRELRRDYSRGDGDPRWYVLAGRVALDLWDWNAWDELAVRQIQTQRDSGLLTLLPVALAFRAWMSLHAGRFPDAETLLEEARLITEAVGATMPGVRGGVGGRHVGSIEPVLAAYRGDKNRTLNLVRASTAHATVHAEEEIPMVHFAAAILHLGLGEYSEALAATELAIGYDDLGLGGYAGYALIQRIEAAARLGETEIATEALNQLIARTEASGTDLAFGLAARSRALLAKGGEAEALYQKAIAHLERTHITMLVARTQLIYGEWLRRENRRHDAREQLRRALDLFVEAGADGFAERATRELVATGDSVRRRNSRASVSLTGRESVVARLASDGYTNQEIAVQLFLSPKTVEWYLTKVFNKLQISSRRGLRKALRDAT
ncbi:helix-turn-helix transcriptional regulator [Mycobacterium sp. URHB0021]